MTGEGHTSFDIFSVEVAPGETYFDRVVDFFALHVDPTLTDPVSPVPSLTAPALTLLTLSLGIIGMKHRR